MLETYFLINQNNKWKDKTLNVINVLLGNHQDIYINFQWNYIDVLYKNKRNNPCRCSQGMVADMENYFPQSNFYF